MMTWTYDTLFAAWMQTTGRLRVYELLVGKGALKVGRDPLQRVREPVECRFIEHVVPMGEAQGWSNVECRFIEHVHALLALSTCQPFAPHAPLPTTDSYTPQVGHNQGSAPLTGGRA
jgi:hypothetical protein